MHIDRPVESLQRLPLGLVHQLLARHHASRMAGQHPQQVELVARQRPPLTGHPHLAGCLVNFQIVDGQNLMATGSQRVSCRPTSLGATRTTATNTATDATSATNTAGNTGTTSSAGLTRSPGSQAACNCCPVRPAGAR